MILETRVRDCLFLNWAVPVAALPEPVHPLRYQVHSWQGEDYTFVSAVLFQQSGVHFTALPQLRFSYPQCNLRLSVLDGEGIPSVLFRTMLLPLWVVPGARLVSRQPVASARLDFPRPSRDVSGGRGEGSWRWRIERGATLAVTARMASPAPGHGPRLGSFEETVEYFQERSRGYGSDNGTLRRIESSHPSNLPVWPLAAEVTAGDLLPALLPLAGPSGGDLGAGGWPPLHSTWLCPEIPFIFDLGLAPRLPVPAPLPQAATSGGTAYQPGRTAAALRDGKVRDELARRRAAAAAQTAHDEAEVCARRAC
jgi:hypothetical protein